MKKDANTYILTNYAQNQPNNKNINKFTLTSRLTWHICLQLPILPVCNQMWTVVVNMRSQ